MLSWVVLLLIGAGFQLYLVNRTIFKTLSTGHYLLMKSAFERNCSQNNEHCKWHRGNAILDPQTVPEVRLPRLTIFNRPSQMPRRLYTTADYRPQDVDLAACNEDPQRWCIRMNIGAGTYQGYFEALAEGAGGYRVNSGFLQDVFDGGLSSIIRNATDQIWDSYNKQ
jgi:hypothetical protein